MASYADLSPCDYFGRWAELLVAVGWIEHVPAPPGGPVSQAFFDRLAELLVDPWQPVVAAGRFPCPFCRFSGGPAQQAFGDRVVTMGAANLFVPGEDRVFVAPSLVLHTIDAHGYCPPEVFQEAVLRCPPMKSVAYLEAVRPLRVT